MNAASRQKHVYDHRLRVLIHKTGDINVALKLDIPRSTATSWLKTPPRPVISHECCNMTDIEVRANLLKLQRRVKVLTAVMILLLTVIRLFRITLNYKRLSEGKSKNRLLHTIERAQRFLPLKIILKILGLSSSRYHSWMRAKDNN